MTVSIHSTAQQGAHDTRFSIFHIIWDGDAGDEVQIAGLPAAVQVYSLVWAASTGTAQPAVGRRSGWTPGDPLTEVG